MPTPMSIKAKNLRQWQALAKRTGAAFRTPDVVQRITAMLNARMKRHVREQFRSEGSWSGGKWKELSPDYAIRKRRKFGARLILRASRRMFREFTSSPFVRGSAVGGGFMYRYGVTETDYAEYHQKGTPKMPMRKIIDFNTRQLRGMGAAIGRTLVDGLFTRGWFNRLDKNRILPGFKITGDAFDIVDLP